MSRTNGIPPQDAAQKRQPRGLIPPEIIALVVPPVQVGTWCGKSLSSSNVLPATISDSLLGGAGASVGMVAAILRDASPWMSAAMTGTQWAVLGSTYWCKFKR